MIELLDSENADRDISAWIVCLTDTPDANEATHCQACFALGDGVKDLDGTGGTFKTRVNVDAQQSAEKSHVLTAANTRAFIETDTFFVPAGIAVTVEVLSPNGADNDVDVTAYLYDLDPLAVTPSLDILTTLATTVRGLLIQSWRRFFKKSQIDHTNLTVKTFKDDGTTAVTTQAISESSTVETQEGAT